MEPHSRKYHFYSLLLAILLAQFLYQEAAICRNLTVGVWNEAERLFVLDIIAEDELGERCIFTLHYSYDA